MKAFQTVVVSNRIRNYVVYFNFVENTIQFPSRDPVVVPASADDYRYTHGGDLYRSAVERFWSEKEKANLDSI